MLELKSLGLKRDRWILRNVDLTFNEGLIYGIIGKSGAGKTTLLKLAAGLLDATEGTVSFMNQQLIGPSEKLIPGYDDIQLVNQDFALEPYHSVEQNVREKILSRHKNDQAELIDEFLELVELKHLKKQKANSLSGGEQQRLAIAGALACEPKVLLLDEPFVHLDQRLRWKVLNYLRKLNKEMQTTVILVSHDGSEMMGFTDEIVYLNNGSVKRIGTAAELYYGPESKEEAELMGEVNQVKIDGIKCLFRPNEYRIEKNKGIQVKFLHALDTGLVYFNYFQTQNGENLLLSGVKPMNEVKHISVKKHI